MSKPKTYEYEGRTFEVKAYSGDEYGAFLFIYVYEVIHPNHKFFGRTRFFARILFFSTNIFLLMTQ